MTLLVTEFIPLDGMEKSAVVFAADRRISRGGNYYDTQPKLIRIPHLRAGLGYFGLAEVQRVPMHDVLRAIIESRRAREASSLQEMADIIAEQLNGRIGPVERRQRSGLHLAGYGTENLPEFWFIRNVDDLGNPDSDVYRVREDFKRGHLKTLGYDGSNLKSVPTGRVFTYRNGDLRAHEYAWTKLDEAFAAILKHPDFRPVENVKDYAEWVKFKMKVIAFLYKAWCKTPVIGPPIDTIVLKSPNLD